MHELRSRKPDEQQHTSTTQQASRTKHAPQRTRTRAIPLYASTWGNQPSPWLRLSTISPDAPPSQPMQKVPHRGTTFDGQQGNTTGLPDMLKAGVEHLSGLSLDDVHVHYQSPRPAEVQALAYTQGTDIHIAPGQEQHLAHEAWHVVQQKRGHVDATRRIGGASVNDDRLLEREADAMGQRAAHGPSRPYTFPFSQLRSDSSATAVTRQHMIIQRKPVVSFLTDVEETKVETEIKAKQFQKALDALIGSVYFSTLKPANVHSVKFDAHFSDYGQALQDRKDPKVHNEVDIEIGPLAFKSISVLVSTLQHELTHAAQYTQASMKNIKNSTFVYGYAKEGSSSSSKYIAAAQEVETHTWEIENAKQTGIENDIDFLRDRGFALLKYWAQLYSAGTGPGVKKRSKPAQYYLALKERVQDAFAILKKAGIAVDKTYFIHGSYYGLKIP